MAEVSRADKEAGEFIVRGELGFATVRDLLDGLPVADLPRGSCVNIDLDGVTRTDSAGLALLVSWMREAKHCGLDIRFVNVPEQMLAIARVSGFDRILPAEGG